MNPNEDRKSRMSLWGCAIDARRSCRRRPAERAWRTDERMRLVPVGGHRIRVVDTEGEGPAVLLAADAPVVLEHYISLIEILAPHCRVVALEMPGFGFSTSSPHYRFTLGEQVDVVIGLMDALGIKSAHLAFTCVNALVACAVSRRAPARVERLTLGQLPGVEAFRAWARRIDLTIAGRGLLATPAVGQAIMALAPGRVAAMWFERVSGPRADVKAISRVSEQVYRDGGMFCLAALTQALADVTPEEVGPVEVPTTFLWGTADRSHRRTNRRSSLSLAADAQIHELEDLGHCFDIEDPARAARLILGTGGA